MLKAYPGAKVIWCHAGQVRYPNKQSVYGPEYLGKRFSGGRISVPSLG